MKKIELHEDFELSPKGIELLERIDPEMRKSDITPEFIEQLQQQDPEPVRDFKWSRDGKMVRISDMDPETMLKVAQHCVKRTNLYHDKILFFLEVVSIIEEHAKHKFDMEVPDSYDEIEEKLEQLRNVRAHKQQEMEEALKAVVSGKADVQSIADDVKN